MAQQLESQLYRIILIIQAKMWNFCLFISSSKKAFLYVSVLVNLKVCELHLSRYLNLVAARIDGSIIKKLGHPFIELPLLILFFIEVEN